MPASACTAAIVDFVVLFVPAPTISCADRSAQTRAHASITGALLVGVERGGLARGAQRDDPGGAGVEVLATETLDRVDRDRAIGCRTA